MCDTQRDIARGREVLRVIRSRKLAFWKRIFHRNRRNQIICIHQREGVTFHLHDNRSNKNNKTNSLNFPL